MLRVCLFAPHFKELTMLFKTIPNPKGKVVGIGIDLLDISRMRRLLNDENMSVLKEIFSANEISRSQVYNDYIKYYAICFALKEAVIKAIGEDELRGFYWRYIDVNVQNGAIETYNIVLDYKLKASISVFYGSYDICNGCVCAVVLACA